MYVYVHMLRMYGYPWKPEDDARSPGAGVSYKWCEPPDWGSGKWSALEGQQVTKCSAEPSLEVLDPTLCLQEFDSFRFLIE